MFENFWREFKTIKKLRLFQHKKFLENSRISYIDFVSFNKNIL